LPTWIIDAGSWEIEFANKAVQRLYGYAELDSFLDLFTEESKVEFFQKLAQASEAAQLNGSYQHSKMNGERVVVDLYASEIFTDHKKLYQITVIDTTGRALTEEKLQREKDHYKAYIDRSSAGIYCQELKVPVSIHLPVEELIDRLKADSYISDCNKAMAEMYGYSDVCELLGQAPDQLVNFDDPANLEFFKSFIVNGFRVLNAESHEKDKDGNPKYFLNNAIGIVENDYLKRIWGTQRDITEQKLAEKKLIESEKRFRELADSAPVMIWMNDEHQRNNYLNKKWLDFTGKDITGNGMEEWICLVHPDDLEKTRQQYEQAFRNRKAVTLVYRLRSRDGSYRWMNDVCVPRFLSDGNFVGYIGSLIDIDEQKTKRDQLRYQATILENVSDIIVSSTLDGTIKSWNKAAEQFYGITEQESIGRLVTEVVQLDYLSTTREKALTQLFETGFWKGEVAHCNQNGEVKYLLNTLSLLVNHHNERVGVLTVGRDITDHKIAEQKLQQSEAFYRALTADSLDGVLLLNEQGVISFCSPSVRHVLGYEVAEVEGKSGFEFVHPEDLSWALDSFQKEVIEKPVIKFISIRLLHKNGQWVWCSVRGHNLLSNPHVRSIAIYFHDDSLRKQASEALKESEQRFRSLIKDLQIAVFLFDKEEKIMLCNAALSSMVRIPEEEIVGKHIYDILADDVINERGELIPRSHRPTYYSVQKKQAVKGVVAGIFLPCRKERRWIMVNADPVLDENNEVKHVICSVMDITERKMLEQKLLTDQINYQKQLTQASIDGQEKERREIGKELHDNIGQQLTTIKLFLDLAKSTADESTMEMVNMAIKGVSDVINEIRAMSRSLVPHSLKDLGFVDSVEELIDSITRAQGLKIDLESENFDEASLRENQQLSLFRIVQEQLNNIIKHAKARHISIILKTTPQKVVLKIKDDGQGFDEKNVRKGLGFTNIRNRAEIFGGKAEISSKPGEGCLLRVFMPLLQTTGI
jgi:PAS domain S-box-containing protein